MTTALLISNKFYYSFGVAFYFGYAYFATKKFKI